MRDPNKINNSDRNQWMAQSLAGMKKVTDRPANPSRSNPAPSAAGPQIAKEKVLAQAVQTKQTPPAAAPQKLEPQKKESLGPLDFTGKQIAHGISNTRESRFRLGKQVERAIGKSFSQRSTVINNLMDKVSPSGKMNVRDAKHAIWNSGLTRGQEQRLMKHLGI